MRYTYPLREADPSPRHGKDREGIAKDLSLGRIFTGIVAFFIADLFDVAK